jgi:hypothetical protein
MSVQTMDTTIQRFNNIRWHDSKLRGLCFYGAEGEERVKISLELLGKDGALTPAEVVFKGSVYTEMDVYLTAKRMCSDDISSAECYLSSDWKTTVSEPSPFDIVLGNRGFEQYLHFRISLCPPSGTINVLAMDFSLEMKAPG